MTRDDLATLRRLHEAATPGEWKATNDAYPPGKAWGVNTQTPPAFTVVVHDFVSGADAELIAAARNALPQLLDKISELAELLLEARDAIQPLTTTQVRLHNISLSLADRIEAALEPWKVADDDPNGR